MFGSLLGLWAIKPLDIGPLGSVKGTLNFLAWVSGWDQSIIDWLPVGSLCHPYSSTSHRQSRV